MSPAEIEELEEKLNFEHQELDKMKPIDRKNYELTLLRLQNNASLEWGRDRKEE